MMAPKRRGGRPRLDPDGGHSLSVTVRFTVKDFDALHVKARQARVASVPALIRQLLRGHLADRNR